MYYFLVLSTLFLCSCTCEKENIKNVEQQAQKTIEIQQKQAEIASKPPASRDDIHDWMLGLGKRDKD